MILFSALKRVPWIALDNTQPSDVLVFDTDRDIITASINSVTRFDIERRQYDTYNISLALVDDEDQAVDVSRWTQFMLSVTPQSRPYTPNAVFAIPALFKTDGSDGKVYFEVTSAIAAIAGYYHYRIRATTVTDKLVTLVEGKYRVLRDRT